MTVEAVGDDVGDVVSRPRDSSTEVGDIVGTALGGIVATTVGGIFSVVDAVGDDVGDIVSRPREPSASVGAAVGEDPSGTEGAKVSPTMKMGGRYGSKETRNDRTALKHLRRYQRQATPYSYVGGQNTHTQRTKRAHKDSRVESVEGVQLTDRIQGGRDNRRYSETTPTWQ